jgi:hypothetical protein
MVLNSFSFLVLAYNHEKYIIEHLESIKYQVLTYGSSISVDLLVNDDCSKDQTILLIDSWLLVNSFLFRDIKKIYNKKNRGTAKSVVSLINHINTDSFKLTAGDDLYSFENVFLASNFSNEYAFHTGFPIYFKDSTPYFNPKSTYLHLATEYVYSEGNLYDRFQRFNYHNAPNLFYNLEYIKNEQVLTYLDKFDVTEDWPLQIAISRINPGLKFKYSFKTFVYYRRTSGSTFLTVNNRFVKDKLEIFNDLILHSDRKIVKFFLMIRAFCFRNNKWPFINLFNLELWYFFFYSSPSFLTFLTHFFNFKKDLNVHSQHISLIENNANVFLDKKVYG